MTDYGEICHNVKFHVDRCISGVTGQKIQKVGKFVSLQGQLACSISVKFVAFMQTSLLYDFIKFGAFWLISEEVIGKKL